MTYTIQRTRYETIRIRILNMNNNNIQYNIIKRNQSSRGQEEQLPTMMTTAEEYETLIETFLNDQDVTENSRRAYRWSLRDFFGWIQKNNLLLSALNSVDIFNYKKRLIMEPSEHTGKPRTSLTINAYLRTVKIFYSWASHKGYCKDIAWGLKNVPVSDSFIKMHLTPQECNAMLDTCKGTNNRTTLRDYAFLKLLIGTGIREIEAVRANIEDIQVLRGRNILRVQGKGRTAKDKFVPLMPDILQALTEYLTERPLAEPSDPLFPTDGQKSNQRGTRMSPRTAQSITKKYMRMIGLDAHEYSGHSLRHTAAVLMIKGGANLYDVQKALRHANPSTTQKYLKSIEEEEMLDNPPASIISATLAKN